jgi:plastocyanin
MAEHITGGDFTVRHVEGNTFDATLSLYRDCGTDVGAGFDPYVVITVFDALTNEHLSELDFSIEGFETVIPAFGDLCFVNDLCLEIGIYQTQFTLPDNPNGYYLSKERCCRNHLSINLPDINDMGFVFTVEIPDPALQNSTPYFEDYPTNGYFCVNELNEIDLGAMDLDGDSLVYSLTEPLNGESTAFNPNPPIASSKPYSILSWGNGYSTDNQIGGDVPMTIDEQTGIVTALPTQVGWFTVAMKIEEYRNGELISTVRRELQLSSNICLEDPSFTYIANGLEVTFINDSDLDDFWTWDFGDGNSSTELNPTHIFDEPGVYTVTLTGNNGCAHSIEIDLTITSLFDVQPGNPLSIYPNPAADYIHIERNSNLDNSLLIEIYDLNGKKIFEQALIEEKRLNLSALEHGLYLITILDEFSHKEYLSQKLILVE